jgi:hypothetical protein
MWSAGSVPLEQIGASLHPLLIESCISNTDSRSLKAGLQSKDQSQIEALEIINVSEMAAVHESRSFAPHQLIGDRLRQIGRLIRPLSHTKYRS